MDLSVPPTPGSMIVSAPEVTWQLACDFAALTTGALSTS